MHVQVPRGHVWLEGDNPLNSTDSRQYGPVPWALLQGRALVKVIFLSSTMDGLDWRVQLAYTILLYPPGRSS